MKYTPYVRPAFSAVLGLLLVAGAGAAAADQPEINEAQRLVFTNDYLQDAAPGTTLVYDFSHRRSDGKDDFSDTVKMTVTASGKDGRHDLSFDFLTGDRQVGFHPASGYKGNPLPIQFLERDVDQMAKATGGRSNYFQNRIRRAFLRPEVRPIKVSFQGKEVEATEVSVTPYRNDPNLDRFRSYANKRYEFTFSEQVPGGLYRIRTRVPEAKGLAPVAEEEMTFIKAIARETAAGADLNSATAAKE
jgi:hypothetical protein